MFLTALWSIHTAFLEHLNSSQTINNLPYIRLCHHVSTVFQQTLFGTNWPERLKEQIQGWPAPWFLKIDFNSKSVSFNPYPPPIPMTTTPPDPTDHPLD